MLETYSKAERQEVTNSDLVQVIYLEKEISDLDQRIIDAKKELENLQDKLAQIEHQKTEAEVQTENIVKNAERRMTKVLHEIEELEKRKMNLEKRCTELYAKNGQMVSDLGMKSKELQNIKAELEKAGNQQDSINQKHKSNKKRFILKAVLGISMVFILLDWVYLKQKISGLEISKEEALAQLSDMEEYASRLEASKEEALAQLSDIEEYAFRLETSKEETLLQLLDKEEYISQLEAREAIVKVNNVYNADGYQNRIGSLKASEMRYLQIDFNVCFLEENIKGATIYVDIYNPDDSLRSGNKSPDGHTASVDVDGSDNVKIGWGNSQESSYTSGIYRVDFIYKDVIIHSQKVEISD